MLEHEALERVFTWQEERRATQNLTLHYKRVMYLLGPSEVARSAIGKHVLVRETNDIALTSCATRGSNTVKAAGVAPIARDDEPRIAA